MDKVVIKNLRKLYSGRPVLDIDELGIRKSEFFVLLGHSGSGKTTLLDCIAGFTVPENGEVLLDGISLAGVPTRDRGLGYMFQSGGVYPHMTVYDNIAFPLHNRKVHKKEIEKKVERLAGLLHISNLLKRKPAQLSGGEQQRTALAKVLASEPKLLLFDEPLSQLDVGLRGALREEILRIHKETQATSIWVTHDQNEAAMISDRIAILEKGQIVQIGTFEELTVNPKNLAVSKFIGSPSINVIDSTDGIVETHASEGTVLRFAPELKSKIMNLLAQGSVFAFHPEANQKNNDSDHGLIINGRVIDTRFLAGRMIARLVVGGKSIFLSGEAGFVSPMQPFEAFIPAERLFLFSPKGDRIHLNELGT